VFSIQIIYIYDIKAANKKKFNRTKRVFYYRLNKMMLKKEMRKTKSTLAVPTKMEKAMDSFFKIFGKDILVYKIFAESVEEF